MRALTIAFTIVTVLELCSLLQGLSSSEASRGLRMSSTSQGSPTVATSSTGPTVLRCSELSKKFAEIPQFQDISFTLGKGQRVGLIGINGAGKSTLLKCLACIETADAGTVHTQKLCNVVYVDQEPDWGDHLVYEALFDGHSDQVGFHTTDIQTTDHSQVLTTQF